jgi:hypothetical protein
MDTRTDQLGTDEAMLLEAFRGHGDVDGHEPTAPTLDRRAGRRGRDTHQRLIDLSEDGYLERLPDDRHDAATEHGIYERFRLTARGGAFLWAMTWRVVDTNDGRQAGPDVTTLVQAEALAVALIESNYSGHRLELQWHHQRRGWTGSGRFFGGL